jgi:hypothetical protein
MQLRMASLLRSRRTRAFCVLAMILHVATFAVYLKAAAVEPVHAQTSQVKLWADGDRALDVQTKASPAPFLPFILLFVLVLLPSEGSPFQLLVKTFSTPKTFFRSPNWLRPPPLFL